MKPTRLLLLLLLALGTSCTLFAQSDKLIKELQNRRADLQKQIKESESLVNSTKKDVAGQLNTLASISGQIAERERYIKHINNDVESINRQLTGLERELVVLERSLKEAKQKYEASVQYLHKNRSVEEKLLFIFSAETLSQTYRRIRYVNEYAEYQRKQGEEILKKQEDINDKKKELLATRKAKEGLLKEREAERERLAVEEKAKKTLVASLQKKQKTLQSELNKKRQEAAKLNQRIDKLIAEAIEKSNKETTPKGKKTNTTTFTMGAAERELSGNFTSNKGKLPMPVTGSYLIVNRYGQYSVEGLRNVRLDNKGIDIQAKPGAKARAVFNGEVTAVFEVAGLVNILIRHGNYITVYCNLTSASVKKGDKVKTNQELGPIFSDKTDNNRTVLHFQLRKEREQLNPESWLAR